MSFVADFDAHSILDTSRDFDIALDNFFLRSLAVTSATFLTDDRSSSSAMRTTHRLFHHTKNGLHLLSNATIPMTFSTGLDFSTIFCTIATTTSTYGFAFEFD